MGKLYVLESNGVYKIGITTGNTNKRVKALQTGNPYKINKVFVKACSNYAYMEKYFHRKFKHKRLIGEWFELGEDDIQFIINCKKYSIFKVRVCN